MILFVQTTTLALLTLDDDIFDPILHTENHTRRRTFAFGFLSPFAGVAPTGRGQRRADRYPD
jgi:hypothetical protein